MQAVLSWLGSKFVSSDNSSEILKTRKLWRWLEIYIEEKGERYAAKHNAGFVSDFIKWLSSDLDLYDLTEEIIKEHLSETYRGHHYLWRADARKAINAWLRFWRNRGHKYLPQVYDDESR